MAITFIDLESSVFFVASLVFQSKTLSLLHHILPQELRLEVTDYFAICEGLALTQRFLEHFR